MKTFRTSLWFIIPLLAIPICIATAYFTGFSNYIRMFLDDRIYIRSVLQVLPVAVGGCVAICFVLFFMKKLLFNYRRIRIADPILIPVSFVLTAAAVYIPLYWKEFYRGSASTDQAISVIISHMTDYQPTSPHLIYIHLLLISLWLGVFICFIFWLLEKPILKRIKRRKADRSTLNPPPSDL